MGGNLVTINDAAENQWIAKQFGVNRWIGFDQEQEGNWKWISGEPVTYTNWSANEPNNAGNGSAHIEGEDWAHTWGGATWNDLDKVDMDGSWKFLGVAEIRPGTGVAASSDAQAKLDVTPVNDTHL